jgi:hypothetical protein
MGRDDAINCNLPLSERRIACYDHAYIENFLPGS